MYRTPEIVDLYSNFPISEKQDIWVRPTTCVWLQGGLRGWATGPRPQVWLPTAQEATFFLASLPVPRCLIFLSHCDGLEEMDE